MDWLFVKFEAFASKTAIIDGEKSYTFKELSDHVASAYKKVKNTVTEATTVALISDYSFFSIVTFLALIKNKNIIAPLIDTSQAERDRKLQQGGVEGRLEVGDGGVFSFNSISTAFKSPFIEELQKKAHAGLILFSSGTTGEPKAMIHDLTDMLQSYRDKRVRNLRMLIFLMFDHIGGLNTLFNCLSSTTSIILTRSRDPENICRLIENHQVNVLPTTPTFLNILLISGAYENYDLGSLKLITYGTEYMPENLLRRLNAAFPRVKFLQTFGTSEVGIAGTKSFSSSSNLIRITGNDVRYKIVNGELYLKGKNQVLGYLSGDTSEFEDGWFKTGDMVEEKGDGFLRIISRKDDIINVGGEKVFPTEIENTLLELPFVDECAAYGTKNPITGESVAVDVVITRDSDQKSAKKEIRNYCFQNLAPYKVPTKINFKNNISVTDRYKKKRKADK